MRTFTAYIEYDPETNLYVGTIPNIRGAHSQGATLDELVVATEWQSRTVRGAMAGALKKKLGLTIESEKIETIGRVYKVTG